MAAGSCLPAARVRESFVDGPRILAVTAEPPEASPGEEVAYQALVVTPAGTVTETPVAWEFCVAPTSMTETAGVTEACLGQGLVPIGVGVGAVLGTTPLDACSAFGPDAPPGIAPRRQGDSTGGFFQPIRLGALQLVAVGLERIRCGLVNAPADAQLEFADRYVANMNPKQRPLVVRVAGAALELGAVPAGASLELEVGWDASEAEGYVSYEPHLQRVIVRREALVVAWFITGGELPVDVTGRAEDDLETTARTLWRAPAVPGVVHLWTVLRDSRGGSSAAAYELLVVTP